MQTRAQLRKCIAGIGCIGDIKQRSGYIRKVDEGKRGKGSKSTKPESTRKSTSVHTALYALSIYGLDTLTRLSRQLTLPHAFPTFPRVYLWSLPTTITTRFQHNARSRWLANVLSNDYLFKNDAVSFDIRLSS